MRQSCTSSTLYNTHRYTIHEHSQPAPPPPPRLVDLFLVRLLLELQVAARLRLRALQLGLLTRGSDWSTRVNHNTIVYQLYTIQTCTLGRLRSPALFSLAFTWAFFEASASAMEASDCALETVMRACAWF